MDVGELLMLPIRAIVEPAVVGLLMFEFTGKTIGPVDDVGFGRQLLK